MRTRLQQRTLDAITHVFATLDYSALAAIYCDEGGEAFWEERRGPAQELGIQLAEVLLGRLTPKGHKALGQFVEEWQRFRDSVDRFVEGGKR